MRLKRIIKSLVLWLFFIPLVLYRHKCKRAFQAALGVAEVFDGEFILAQDQYGAILSLLTYADYWARYRSKIRLIIVSSKFPSIIPLIDRAEIKAEVIAPSIFINKKLNKLFQNILQEKVFDQIYKELIYIYPHLIYIYEKFRENRTRYHSQYDPNLKSIPAPLKDPYVKFRKIFDCRIEVIEDFYRLVNEKQTHPSASSDLPEFALKLGIKKPFVMLSINSKNYGQSHRNHRSVNNYEFYETLISCLHERGFNVVIFGGAEQSILKSKKALINYAHSQFQTMENDFLLAKSSEFIVSGKSGTEWLACIANRYMLGLNYAELTSMSPNLYMRYVPKGIKVPAKGELTWREYLERAEFFEIGNHRPAEDIEYIDLKPAMAEPILEEFCSFMGSHETIYSKIQEEFKAALGPYHMDSYLIKSVPLDCYLKEEDIGC
jgi:hypothetical protein